MNDLLNKYNAWHESVITKESFSELSLCQWHTEAMRVSPELKGKKVLEVGCGRGDFSILLSQSGAYVHGIDFSDAAISIAKKKGQAHNIEIEFSVGDAQDLSFPDNSFDIIYSCECIEHLPDPQKALREFNRILKAGGIAIVTTENYSNGMIFLWLKSWITGKPFNSGSEIQPIENFFVYWNVIKMMKKVGFIIKSVTGWHYVFLILPRNKNIIVNNFKNKLLRFLFKPFARHMTFLIQKGS